MNYEEVNLASCRKYLSDPHVHMNPMGPLGWVSAGPAAAPSGTPAAELERNLTVESEAGRIDALLDQEAAKVAARIEAYRLEHADQVERGRRAIYERWNTPEE